MTSPLEGRDDHASEREVQEFSQKLLGMIDQAFLHEIQHQGLAKMLRLTGSTVGICYSVSHGPATISVHAATLAGRMPLPPVRGREIGLDQEGYWSACVARGQPVVRNAAADLPRPLAGDIGPITRDVTVPIHDGGKIVAVILIGNRDRDYAPADADLVAELGAALWRVVVRKRLLDSMSDDVK
jgi:GAF domain-containing protein